MSGTTKHPAPGTTSRAVAAQRPLTGRRQKPCLVAGSVASLAANVAVAQPTSTGRVIAAWPSFALIAAYELLMRQVRRSAAASGKAQLRKFGPQISPREALDGNARRPRQRALVLGAHSEGPRGRNGAGRDLQRQAWQWAVANRAGDGSLPSGREIARQYGRHERWGRLVKRAGTAGEPAETTPGVGMLAARSGW